jgi:hypothetical protein
MMKEKECLDAERGRVKLGPASSVSLMGNVDRASIGLQIAGALGVCLGVQRNGLVREFPFFSAFICLDLIILPFKLLAREMWRVSTSWYPLYFYWEWTLHIVSILLSLGAMYEIYAQVFSDYTGLRHLSGVLFRWCTAIMVLVGVVASAAVTSREESSFLAGLLAFQLASYIVSAGLMLFLFMFSMAFGLKLKHYARGIGLGFALTATVALVTVTVRLHEGFSAGGVYIYVGRAAYISTLLIWVIYLNSPERATVPSRALPSHNLEQWDKALVALLNT